MIVGPVKLGHKLVNIISFIQLCIENFIYKINMDFTTNIFRKSFKLDECL